MMNSYYKLLSFFVFSFVCLSVQAHPNHYKEYVTYCTQSGGVVEEMPAQFGSSINGDWIHGMTKYFCNFYLEHAFIAIGLSTFASESPSIAATYMKRLGEISDDSPLWKGDSPNPSQNVCKNLGGASIGFLMSGGFANEKGQSDICVFGDGSMVSGWSLIYMANHREGYDAIKEKVKGIVLNFPMPLK